MARSRHSRRRRMARHERAGLSATARVVTGGAADGMPYGGGLGGKPVAER
ncbi:hypothetical protein [Nonomuraea dietziae]